MKPNDIGHADRVIRRWLSKTPLLLTAYFERTNRSPRRGRVRLSAAVSLSIAGIIAMSLFVHADRAAALSMLAWLDRHDLFCATIAAIVAGVLVSRRRALNRTAAARSWVAALPVKRSVRRWQAIAVALPPAFLLACILAVLFGGVTLIAWVDAGIPVPALTWAAMTGGIVLGVGISYVLPAAGQEEIYERSRYVPHRRRAETAVPTGSLSALGTWPVRHMFASARPKTVARTLIPVLLAVPMGSSAAAAMLALATLTAVGALLLLVVASISVSAEASRWLMPLPVGAKALARRILIPVLATLLCLSAIQAWLAWVGGSPIQSCILTGGITFLAGAVLALTGSVLAIHASDRAKHGRP